MDGYPEAFQFTCSWFWSIPSWLFNNWLKKSEMKIIYFTKILTSHFSSSYFQNFKQHSKITVNIFIIMINAYFENNICCNKSSPLPHSKWNIPPEALSLQFDLLINSIVQSVAGYISRAMTLERTTAHLATCTIIIMNYV